VRRFSLYKRNEIFYVRFWNPETKKYTSAREPERSSNLVSEMSRGIDSRRGAAPAAGTTKARLISPDSEGAYYQQRELFSMRLSGGESL